MPKMICKYSKCGKEYQACEDSVQQGKFRECGCSFDHYAKYQNEVAYFRGQEMPFPEVIEGMVTEGALPESVLPKEEVQIEEIKGKNPLCW